MATDQEAQAAFDAWTPPPAKDAQPHPMAGPAGTPPDPIQAAMAPAPKTPTPSFLDSVVSYADNYKSRLGDIANRLGAVIPSSPLVRPLISGAIKGAVKTADSVGSMLESSGRGLAAAEDPAHAQEALNGPDISHPIYDAARKVIMDMRDAIAIKDPNLPQSLIEGFGQFAGPYALYSRMLGSFGTAANLFKGEGALAAFGNKVAAKAASTATAVGADAITNATANAPHDPRVADLLALHKDAEGKYVDMLSSIASSDNPLYPVHEYINYLASPDHSEAEGRWKNVLDGLNVFGALAGVFFGGAATFKTGWGAMHIMADNNMGSMGDLMPANQEGKIGYHGTPNAPFEAFSNNAIGTGQGAQSYGYGHYIAENAATGETYQKSLSGKMNTSAALSDAQSAIKTAGGDKVKAVKNLTDMLANETDTALRQRMQNSVRLIKSGNADAGKGSLLKVEIDDKHIDNMLDLDKPMSKQPEILNKIPMKDQQKLQQVLEDHGQDLELNELTGNEFRQLIERSYNEGYLQPSTKSLYGTAVNPAGDASSYLSGRGILGNKYFDSKSRVTGEGTRNYVVFDGKHIKVLGQEK